MTDEQIIKAYEGLTPIQQLNLYRNLYYKDGNATERGVVANAINALLTEYNRQKEEIDRFADIGKMYSEVRSDAIREFAERLRTKRGSHGEIWGGDIDNLVKEMTEDNP